MLRRALLLLSIGLFACDKEEPVPAPKAESEKAPVDDDEPNKNAQKKKFDDDPAPVKKAAPQPSSDDADKGRKASVVPEGTPIPPGCAPDPSGILGVKPTLVTSAGQPGASMAIWQKEGDPKVVAITISADGKCYVDYLEEKSGPSTVQLLGMTFDKGAIQAVTGTTEKGGATIVGFKVTYSTGTALAGVKSFTTEARFYGYVAANGTPYSCAKLANEKGDRCAMYHKPLTVETSAYCKMETGGGPPMPPIKPLGKGVIIPTKPSASASTSAAPSTSASAPILPDLTKCDGTPACSTSALMSKDNEHVNVRISAGKPKACNGNKIGDTWYFDENTWKKR